MSVDSWVWTVRDGPVRGVEVPTGINVGIGAGLVVAAAAVPASAAAVRLTVMGAALAGSAALTVDLGWSREVARRA